MMLLMVGKMIPRKMKLEQTVSLRGNERVAWSYLWLVLLGRDPEQMASPATSCLGVALQSRLMLSMGQGKEMTSQQGVARVATGSQWRMRPQHETSWWVVDNQKML